MKKEFDCHLPNLLDEVLSNPSTGILFIPIQITKRILAELAQLAIELDNDRLHIMMLRLGLYEIDAKERVNEIKRLREKILKEKEAANGK